jgi:FAD/FMN-containing dehydrogenase
LPTHRQSRESHHEELPDDIKQAVLFAKSHGDGALAVRGGGHNIAGYGVCEAGVLLDLSLMRKVTVDPEGRTATVEGGALLGDVDAATQAHGLAVPLGINSTTGVGGLTLGGGFGWITRKHGLTVDNLVGATVVIADGTEVHCSETQHDDLFWALRGGSGNFGVVASFTYRLHPVGTEMLTGFVVHRAESADAALDAYETMMKVAPEDLSVFCVLARAPPLPFLPTEHHGTPVVMFPFMYLGDDRDKCSKLVDQLRQPGEPLADVMMTTPYVAWQQLMDKAMAGGMRNYWKSHCLRDMSEPVRKLFVNALHNLPTPHTEIVLAHLGGAVRRLATEGTAYPHRESDLLMNMHGRWDDRKDDSTCIDWARRLYQDLLPHSTGASYVNFVGDAPPDRSPAENAYATNFPRLQRVKTRYDPGNMFRHNINIKPASAGMCPLIVFPTGLCVLTHPFV